MKKIIGLSKTLSGSLALWLAVGLPLMAAETGQINYQARLLDSYGRRLNTTVNLSFAIYDAATNGNLLWSETQPDVVVEDGVYSVVLGSQTPIPASVFSQNAVYLELGINGEIMTPRPQILAAAYALVARTVMGSNIFENQTSGYIGVGTTNPAAKLDVSGTLKATGFKMPSGATANYVLVSDADGAGTWQPPSAVVIESDPIHTNWVRVVYTPATNGIWGAIGAEATTRGNADTMLQNNIDTSSNALGTAIGTEATTRGNADTALQNNVNTSSNALNTAVGLRLFRAGDSMTGPLTNLVGFVGNGFGLTNIQDSGFVSTSYVRKAGDTMSGALVISNNLTVALTNVAGTTNFISLGGVAISNWNQVSGGNLTNDLSNLQGATNTLNTAITNEAMTRGNTDLGISNAYIAADTVVSNGLDAKVTAEATARGNADAGISNAYIAADTVVSNALDAKVTAEATARGNADAGISNAYIAADTVVSNGLDAKVNLRVLKAGDSMTGPLVISNNLTVALTNTAGDVVATNSISLRGTFITNWYNLTGSLNTAIGNEATARGDADAGISNAYIAADTVVSNGLDAKVNLRVLKAGDTMTGALVISNNLTVISNVTVTGTNQVNILYVTNAIILQNAAAITNWLGLTNDALLGAIYARRDVGVTNIAANAVTNAQIANAAVTGPKIAGGWTGIVTNRSTLITNVMYFYYGICTNNVVNP